MRVPGSFHWPSPPTGPEDITAWAKDLNEAMKQHLQSMLEVINGSITLGDGVDVDNFAGQPKLIVSGTAGAELTIPHDLGQVPVGFILIVPPQSGSVNKGPTPWTNTNIFLSCSAATQTFTIFILAPPSR